MLLLKSFTRRRGDLSKWSRRRDAVTDVSRYRLTCVFREHRRCGHLFSVNRIVFVYFNSVSSLTSYKSNSIKRFSLDNMDWYWENIYRMAPNISSGALAETDPEVLTSYIPNNVSKADNRKLKLVWRNIILMGLLHAGAIYGLYLAFASTMLITTVYSKFSFSFI